MLGQATTIVLSYFVSPGQVHRDPFRNAAMKLHTLFPLTTAATHPKGPSARSKCNQKLVSLRKLTPALRLQLPHPPCPPFVSPIVFPLLFAHGLYPPALRVHHEGGVVG